MESLTGTFLSEGWRDRDSDFVIASIRTDDSTDPVTVKGDAPRGDLITLLPYTFYGKWKDHPRHGRQFEFKQFVATEPHSRMGIIQYLRRYVSGIQAGIAQQLHDAFGADALKILRTDPERAAVECRSLSLPVAVAAADKLTADLKFQDTKIELENLLAGRGFPAKLRDQVIRRWGILAPRRIQRDPFSLLVFGFAGCGFDRCDRLYTDLGNPPDRLKRQMLCIWNALRTDNNGHTWHPLQSAVRAVEQKVSQTVTRPKRALQLGVRAKWLVVKQDADGRWWIAERAKAENERTVVDCVREIQGWTPPRISRQAAKVPYPVALPGECGEGSGIGNELESGEMDATELARIGQQTGICQFCGRRLVTAESLAVGYGPVCAAKYGLPWGEVVEAGR